MSPTTRAWRENVIGKCCTLAMSCIKRRVILHYHLFKNAGSSVDHILATNFGDRWSTVEGPQPWSVLSADELLAFIYQHPSLLAISSHTARLPLPHSPEITFYPILFLRHPIDRVGSIYNFEKHRQDESFSAVTARTGSLSNYVQKMMESEHNDAIVFSNFQTLCLSNAATGLSDLRQAHVSNLHLIEAQQFLSTLPAFGLVEYFDQSVQHLGKWLRSPFPGINFFPARFNTQFERGSMLEERLAHIQKELGPSLYAHLEEINQHDMAFYHYACKLFHRRANSSSP